LEQLHNQQSVVRTDFTLKYYSLESLIKEHDLLEVTGSDRYVFVRSWVDYVKAKGDVVITWAEGDFLKLLEIVSNYSDEEISDDATLKDYLNQQTTELILCVDAQEIEIDQLQKLLVIINALDRPSASIENTVPESEYLSSETPALSNIKLVLCMPDTSKVKFGDREINVSRSATFHVGDAGANKSQSKISSPYSQSIKEKSSTGTWKLIVLSLVIASGLIWHFKQDLNDKFETVGKEIFADIFGVSTDLKADTGNDSQTSNVEAVPNNEVAKKSELVNEQSSKTEAIEDLKSVATKVDDTAQMPLKNTELKAEIATSTANDVKEVDSVFIEKAVTKVGSENDEGSIPANVIALPEQEELVIAAKAVDPALNPERNSKPVASEQVAISSAKSANSVNLGSSIRTQSNQGENAKATDTEASIDTAIAQFVDGWMGAWQKQSFDEYQQFYSDSFKSGGQSSHERWLKWRKKRIERPKWIKLSRSNIKHLSQEPANLYQIQLTLMYSSPNYRDKTFKRMTIKKLSDSTFKIVKEENLKVTKI
jgi:hypothetical protein